MNNEQVVKTTLRLDAYNHKVLKAACALSGESLSEFITRVARAELERLLNEKTERDSKQPD